MKGSNGILAIGTSSKAVHLWDCNKFSMIRKISGYHEGRISSLSWNPLHTSLLSSGSLDSKIINIDTRMNESIVSTYKGHR